MGMDHLFITKLQTQGLRQCNSQYRRDQGAGRYRSKTSEKVRFGFDCLRFLGESSCSLDASEIRREKHVGWC